MRIAVDARFLRPDTTSQFEDFIRELMFRLAKLHPEHQFIFLSDTHIDPLSLYPNISLVILAPKPSNALLYKWWYDIKVSLALKKYKADSFICTSGWCSLTASVNQVLIIRDLAFFHNAVFSSKINGYFYRLFRAKFLKKAKLVVALSDFIKNEIVTAYKALAPNIAKISGAADRSFKPLDWEEREKVKEQYAQGCEYFVFTNAAKPAKNLINLLKAFSIFKKWQKTNMKLVIVMQLAEYKEQEEKIKSYKYKKEIFFAEYLSKQELAKVTGGAYAMIFPSSYEGFGLPVLEAMQCEVPVITSSDRGMAEIAGDAALYVNPESPEELADKMKRIFKDEQLRNELVTAGKEQVKRYSWDKTTALMWDLIQKAVSR